MRPGIPEAILTEIARVAGRLVHQAGSPGAGRVAHSGSGSASVAVAAVLAASAGGVINAALPAMARADGSASEEDRNGGQAPVPTVSRKP